ncbi:response regulator [Hymenobacter weizhouensis]|uniref:response regulator n=1 Tax=Hymenobacter sp. YIM 151500-1 TaxID=2987689 RepID=UPI0022268284|nr:response regulator [Hymenobacter sp. YIM 151500-1]UYZ62509.1 response regulator [Hymenobacter sp. YIM 151500-1]
MVFHTILIVEDEFIIADHLRGVLEQLGHNVLDIAAEVPAAIQLIEEQRPTLVLVDIKLQGELDGVDLATRLRADYHLPFIYITSFSDSATVRRASQTRPYGYLVKPFKDRDVYVALEMAWSAYASETGDSGAVAVVAGEPHRTPDDDGLFVRDRRQRVKVLYQELLWLQAQGNYTNLYTNSGRFSIYSALKQVEQYLPPADFIRVHKSHVVARRHIVALQSQQLILSDGTSVPVGRTYQADLFKRLNVFKSL